MVRNLFLGSAILVGSVVIGIGIGIGLVDLQLSARHWGQNPDSRMLAAERASNPATIDLPEGQVFIYIDHSLPGDIKRYVTRDRVEGEKPRRITIYEHIRSMEFLDVYLYIQEQ